MSAASECDPEQWPPGTVKLEDLFRGGEIILQPRPTVDPNDPLNWAPWRKYLNFGLACMYVVFVFADINAVTPTWGPMNEQNGFSYELLNDSYAAGCAALAIGGPLLIPFALKYGRRPVYVFSTIAQFAIAIWTAKLQTVGDLVAVNTLNCLFGALSEIIVQMTVADVFFVHQRGRMNSYYIWFLNIGGSLAPLAAGYITTGQGWRWVWWWMAIFFGISFLIYAFMFEETKYSSKVYHGTDPLALPEPMSPDQQDTKDDSKTSDSKTVETGVGPSTDIYSTANEIDHTIPMRTYRQRLALWSTSPGSFSKFALHSYQPLVMFFTIPAVFYISLVYSIINATITVMITVLSEYLYEPPYNFNSAQVGLMSLPPFIATSLSLLVAGPLSDWSILYLAKRNNGVYEPEMRLWVIAAFIPFIPAGLWMFGFGLADSRPWPLLAIGYGLLSFGTAPISSISLTYLTDAYTDIVADSMVTITVTRNIVATVFVFAIAPWIDGIGMKNVFVMLGVLMIIIICSVFVFIYCGKKIRVRTASRYRYYAGRQFDTRTFEELKD
ncbi:probable synaptic vesicle transporter SVOP and related transporters (major facilitator superfamily) [Phialocephala subalpina]|uniref:Probable synaptic vesicle transporter SVOP and related transporters (Major facilitator superfamily) n=1 Tax=Phialocephala subalpina TaxID=576137 RepID=A0A1L7WV36_9HELO|nr:probable synaptic vesicle transporter SVOP and related transporters (major facilitator superfamily) [Phialocephala subalpina]